MRSTRGLGPDRRRKVAQIKHALAQSDGVLHAQMVRLDGLQSAASKDATGTVSAAWLRTLSAIHDELLAAVARVGALDTGLRAQEDLRRALIARAAGFEAWRYALASQNLSEITAARMRLQRHFADAAAHGERAAARLKRGV
jgi:hypothetical protein